MSMPIESTIAFLPPSVLQGSIDALTLTEDTGTAPTSIIRTDSPWHIKVDWSLEGSLIPTSFFPPQEKWVVRAFLELMGPSTEYELPKDLGKPDLKLDLSAGTLDTTDPNKMNYTVSIDVDPATDPVKLDAGIYKMVVAVTSENNAGKPGSFAGFFEGKTLQFYDA